MPEFIEYIGRLCESYHFVRVVIIYTPSFPYQYAFLVFHFTNIDPLELISDFILFNLNDKASS